MHIQASKLRRISVQNAGLETVEQSNEGEQKEKEREEVEKELKRVKENEQYLMEQVNEYQQQQNLLSSQVLSLSQMNRSIAEQHQQKDLVAFAQENKSLTHYLSQQQNHFQKTESLRQLLDETRQDTLQVMEKSQLLQQILEKKERQCSQLGDELQNIKEKLSYEQNINEIKQEEQNKLENGYKSQLSENQDLLDKHIVTAEQQTLKVDTLQQTQKAYFQIHQDKNQQIINEKDNTINLLTNKCEQANRQFHAQILQLTQQKQQINQLQQNKILYDEMKQNHQQLNDDHIALQTRYDFLQGQSENHQQQANEYKIKLLSLEKSNKIKELKQQAEKESNSHHLAIMSTCQQKQENQQKRCAQTDSVSTTVPLNSINNSMYISKKQYLIDDQSKYNSQIYYTHNLNLCQSINYKQKIKKQHQRSLTSIKVKQVQDASFYTNYNKFYEVRQINRMSQLVKDQLKQDLMVQYKPQMIEFKQ